MSEKLKEEQLKKVSGGDFIDDWLNTVTYTCKNEKCKKTFKHTEAIFIGNKIYCPHCNSYVGDILEN